MRAQHSRDEAIAKMHAGGIHHADIAAAFGLTPRRVTVIVRKAVREERRALRLPPEGMSLRCALAIEKATELWPSDATADALRALRVNLRKSDGIGWKTMSALNAWLVRVAKGRAR